MVFLWMISGAVVVQTIKLDLLSQIVEKFQKTVGRHVETDRTVPNQMAFVLFVPKCDQANSLNDIDLGNSTKIYTYNTMKPFYDWFSNEMHGKPFYLSAKPIQDSVPKTCSEKIILTDKVPGSYTTIIQWLAEVSQMRGIQPEGSCIIFYSTNTPCTDKCFKANRPTFIVNRMKRSPFLDWKNLKANLIFVFQNVWYRDATYHRMGITRKCLTMLRDLWTIYKCSSNQNQPSCKLCDNNFRNCHLQPERSPPGKKRKISFFS